MSAFFNEKKGILPITEGHQNVAVNASGQNSIVALLHQPETLAILHHIPLILATHPQQHVIFSEQRNQARQGGHRL